MFARGTVPSSFGKIRQQVLRAQVVKLRDNSGAQGAYGCHRRDAFFAPSVDRLQQITTIGGLIAGVAEQFGDTGSLRPLDRWVLADVRWMP